MKLIWLIQDTGFNFQNIEENFETLDRLDIAYHRFGIVPRTKEITGLENFLSEENHFLIRGGTRVLQILNQTENIADLNPYLSPDQKNPVYIERLKNAIFYNEQSFDQNHYALFDLPLLNHNSRFVHMNEAIDMKFERDMFLKPSRDQKSFGAGILPQGCTVREFLAQQKTLPSWSEEHVLFSSVKNITCEWRFFVINQEVITGSLYKLGNMVRYSSEIPADVKEVAKSYAKLYQPHDIFTMDIAETNEGYKIVEYNCFNASGLYACDTMSLFHYAHEYMQERIRQKPAPRLK